MLGTFSLAMPGTETEGVQLGIRTALYRVASMVVVADDCLCHMQAAFVYLI